MAVPYVSPFSGWYKEVGVRAGPGNDTVARPVCDLSGTNTMDDQIRLPTPQHIVDDLDTSVSDIVEGRLHDAKAVEAEARRMLDDYERLRSDGSASPAARRTKRIRSA
jgi:hypothetical protein